MNLIRISLVLSYAPGLLVLTVGTHKAENFTRKQPMQYNPDKDGKTLDNELEVVEGMKLDRGYISLISSPTRTIRNELENPLIIIHEKKISSINDVVKVLELVLQVGMTTAHR
ncbi:Chaperonin CPN60-like 1, mitochondrial [Prunus dulcis]|uniref:Chaperonin CPN60-like 1, mitochondrial n=1 Tax=Prunus dulcis TaxID=3755 RepID=A0A5H2XPT4_PRUDU|nr:Chaperonin CPN60-like 1, mitochondrial [Prunus dulcis]